MEIQYIFNSVQVDQQDLHMLLQKMNTEMQVVHSPKKSKRGRRRGKKKKVLASALIDEIIDSIE